MIGFYVVNLLPPATPLQFNLQTPCGTWEFQQVPNFGQVHPAVLQGATANTEFAGARWRFRVPVFRRRRTPRHRSPRQCIGLISTSMQSWASGRFR
jgi:hypothetical protein